MRIRRGNEDLHGEVACTYAIDGTFNNICGARGDYHLLFDDPRDAGDPQYPAISCVTHIAIARKLHPFQVHRFFPRTCGHQGAHWDLADNRCIIPVEEMLVAKWQKSLVTI